MFVWERDTFQFRSHLLTVTFMVCLFLPCSHLADAAEQTSEIPDWLKKHVGTTMEAIISRVFADGIHARCVKLPVDGFTPVTTLPKDKYRFERRGNMLVGFKDGNRFRLGDQLTVKVAKVDLQDRQLYFEMVKNHTAKNELSTGGSRESGKRKSKSKYKFQRKKDRRDKKKRRRR